MAHLASTDQSDGCGLPVIRGELAMLRRPSWPRGLSAGSAGGSAEWSAPSSSRPRRPISSPVHPSYTLRVLPPPRLPPAPRPVRRPLVAAACEEWRWRHACWCKRCTQDILKSARSTCAPISKRVKSACTPGDFANGRSKAHMRRTCALRVYIHRKHLVLARQMVYEEGRRNRATGRGRGQREHEGKQARKRGAARAPAAVVARAVFHHAQRRSNQHRHDLPRAPRHAHAALAPARSVSTARTPTRPQPIPSFPRLFMQPPTSKHGSLNRVRTIADIRDACVTGRRFLGQIRGARTKTADDCRNRCSR
eukprot:3324163-Pleurochrysis_carterae.AAC.1